MIGIKKVLVTGAGGFIGSSLCPRILAEGWQVRGTVRVESDVSQLPDGVEAFSIGSIDSDTKWDDALEGIDTVVHLAARVHVMDDNSSDPLAEYRKVNVEGTKCFAYAAANAGVKRFVFISSIKVNGEGTEIRGRRSEVGGQEGEPKEFFSEKDVPEPHDPYAVSKWEAEQVLRDVEADTGLEVVILRPPLVYGPGVKANFLRLFKIVERGIPLPLANIKNKRSFIYLANLVDAITTCIIHADSSGQTYLVSDNENISTPELIQRMASALGRPVRLFPIPPFLMRLAGKLLGKSAAIDRILDSLIIDSTKIRKELEWKPPHTMEQGIKETAKWYTKKLVS